MRFKITDLKNVKSGLTLELWSSRVGPSYLIDILWFQSQVFPFAYQTREGWPFLARVGCGEVRTASIEI
jgi:hypothetical protein